MREFELLYFKSKTYNKSASLDRAASELGVNSGAPKYMEWFGALSILVTLVWLYLEMLRPLNGLKRRD